MAHPLSRGALIVGAAGLLLSACGSTTPGTGSDNGISSKSLGDLETTVTGVMKTKKTFEVTGSQAISGTPATIDMKVDFGATPPQLSASVSTSGGGQMTLQVVNGHDYASFNAAAATALGGGSQGAALLAGKCIDFGSSTDTTNPAGGFLGTFGRLNSTNFFSDQTYTKGSVKTVNNVEVVPLMGADGSEIDIATHGDALPVAVVTKPSSSSSGASASAGASGGDGSTTLSFTNWGNASVNVSVPSNCLTLAQLTQGLSGSTPPTDTPSATPDTSGATPTP